MRKDFKCTKCKEVQEITISTAEITGRHGKLDLEKLDELLNEVRYCECGGELKVQPSLVQAMFPNNPNFYDGFTHRHPQYTGVNQRKWSGI